MTTATAPTSAPPVSIKEAWWDLLREERDEQGPKPTADGTRFRASDARMCHRKRGLSALGYQPTNQVADSTLDAFYTGNRIHEAYQRIVTERWGGTIEVVASLTDIGVDVSGSADGLYPVPPLLDTTAVLEIKSMKRFGYNLAVHGAGDPRWKPSCKPGPKAEHLTQAGVYALALGAEYVHIVYVCKDDDAVTEWFFHVEDPLEHLDGQSVADLVADEVLDLERLARQADAGQIPAREVPGFGWVQSLPEFGSNRGDPWLCRYCDFYDLCDTLGPDQVEGSL